MGTEWDVESRMEIERKGNRERMGIVWNREYDTLAIFLPYRGIHICQLCRWVGCILHI